MASAVHSSRSVYFGQKEHGVPEFGIYVDEDKDWCSGVYTNRKTRRSAIVNAWKPSWSVFDQVDGFEEFQNCTNLKEHFQTIHFRTSPHFLDDDFDFSFYVKNTNNTRNEHALAYVYSMQEQDMIMNGFSTPPGKYLQFHRYGDADQAFCLTRNPTLANADSATAMFSHLSEEDVCSYMVLVTQGKGGKKKTQGAKKKIQEGKKKTQGGMRAATASWVHPNVILNQSRRNCEYEYDSIQGCMTADPAPVYEFDSPSGYHTNAVRGKETNQEYFEGGGLDYTGAPINIYNVVLTIC